MHYRHVPPLAIVLSSQYPCTLSEISCWPVCPFSLLCVAGTTVTFTATLTNTGNVKMVGGVVALAGVPPLSCKSGAVNIASESLETSYDNNAGAELPYGHKAVCTGGYTFDQAAFEALTGSLKVFAASAAATGWSITPAAVGWEIAEVAATPQPLMQVVFVASSCTKPVNDSGGCEKCQQQCAAGSCCPDTFTATLSSRLLGAGSVQQIWNTADLHSQSMSIRA